MSENKLPIDAWRYQDARGHFRYRGYRPDFDRAYPLLKPVALTLHAPAQEAADERDRLQAEVEALRKDAERYNTLKHAPTELIRDLTTAAPGRWDDIADAARASVLDDGGTK